jgi:hypothetical protein
MLSTPLLLSIIVFSLLLFILVIFYIRGNRRSKSQIKQSRSQKSTTATPPTFEMLLAIISNQKSSSDELEAALKSVIEYYGVIPPKEGIHPHKMFKKYAQLIITLCRHKNTNSKLILFFDRELQKRNPSYVSNIEEMLQRGLNSRDQSL